MSCEQIGQVHAYHDGEIPSSQRIAFESHLKQCGDCAALLAELRQISELIASAPMAEMPVATMTRLQRTWHTARDRGVMRIASWLTAAAAAILVGAPLLWHSDLDDSLRASGWQTAAVMPPAESRSDESAPDLIVVAQWMANDLSPTEQQGR